MRYYKPGDRVIKISGDHSGEVATVVNYVCLMQYVRIRFDRDFGHVDGVYDAYPEYIQLLRPVD